MKKFFRQIFTEPNNQTFCPVRLMAIAGTLQYLVMNAIHYIRQGAFDPQAFAVGFAALLGGVGVALGTKKDSPPEPKIDDSK